MRRTKQFDEVERRFSKGMDLPVNLINYNHFRHELKVLIEDRVVHAPEEFEAEYDEYDQQWTVNGTVEKYSPHIATLRVTIGWHVEFSHEELGENLLAVMEKIEAVRNEAAEKVDRSLKAIHKEFADDIVKGF